MILWKIVEKYEQNFIFNIQNKLISNKGDCSINYDIFISNNKDFDGVLEHY